MTDTLTEAVPAPPTAEELDRLTAATDFLDHDHETVRAFVDKALQGVDRATATPSNSPSPSTTRCATASTTRCTAPTCRRRG